MDRHASSEPLCNKLRIMYIPYSQVRHFEIDGPKKMCKINLEEHLIVVLMDLFLGGSETTSNMLSFAILYMATHPEVQNNVQREIDQVADGSEFLSLADSKR